MKSKRTSEVTAVIRMLDRVAKAPRRGRALSKRTDTAGAYRGSRSAAELPGQRGSVQLPESPEQSAPVQASEAERRVVEGPVKGEFLGVLIYTGTWVGATEQHSARRGRVNPVVHANNDGIRCARSAQ